MWIFTTLGFFSAVQKPGTDHLTIRARAKGDLDALRAAYLPDLSPTTSQGGSDYPWRATVSHAAFAAALQKMALDIHYPNFKSAVAKAQGSARAHAYGAVWGALLDLPEATVKAPAAPAAEAPWPARAPRGLKVAYGGVVLDGAGRVLLVEPANHFDGYVWTFPKGRPGPGEPPEIAALREVLEETGIQARILAPLPGEFLGGTTANRYYLMEANATKPVQAHDAETAAVVWATPEEARQLLGKTTNAKGRARDLAVLEAALKLGKKE